MDHQDRESCQLTSDTASIARCILISQMLKYVCVGGKDCTLEPTKNGVSLKSESILGGGHFCPHFTEEETEAWPERAQMAGSSMRSRARSLSSDPQA